MSFDAVRQSLFTAVAAAAASYSATLFTMTYENQVSVDLGNSGNPYGLARILYRDSQTSAISDRRTRYLGELQIFLFVKDGEGTKTLNNLADVFADALKYQRFGTVQLQNPRLLPARMIDGWYMLTLALNFYTDVA